MDALKKTKKKEAFYQLLLNIRSTVEMLENKIDQLASENSKIRANMRSMKPTNYVKLSVLSVHLLINNSTELEALSRKNHNENQAAVWSSSNSGSTF